MPPTKKPHFSDSQVKENYNAVRVHLIVNPFSGKKKGLEVAKEVEANLIESKIEVESHITNGPNHAIQIAKSLNLIKGDVVASVGVVSSLMISSG